jgi:peptide/nickel transport system substrate-binding protein
MSWHARDRSLQLMSRRGFLGMVAGGCGLGVVGLLSSPGFAAVSAQGQLIVGDYFTVKTLDPGRTLEILSWEINHATYDSLVTFAGDDLKTPRPSLATKWDVSPDGRTYTFTLRPGVKFASGNPLSSADVKWTLDRVKNLKSNPSFFLDGVEEVQAPTPSTVVIRLSEPKPSIIPRLASPSLAPLDSKVVIANGGDASPDAKAKDAAEPYLNAHAPGTGAFILESYTPNQEAVLTRNPNHWRKPSPLERVVIRNIPEPQAEQFQIARGELDVATGLTVAQAKALRGARNITVRSSPSATSFYILMNQDPTLGGPFSNPKIQQAVRYAIDYQGLMQIAGSGAVRLAGLIPTNFPGALNPRDAVKTDLPRARALIKEANLGEIQGKISYASGWIRMGVEMDLVVQKIQADLAAVGIKMELYGLALPTALQQYRDGKNQFGVWAYAADYPDADDYLVFLPGRNVGKRAHWSEDASPSAQELSKLGQQAESESDLRKRTEQFQRVERMLAQVGPYVGLFQPAIPYAFQSAMGGITYSSVWGLDLYAISKSG